MGEGAAIVILESAEHAAARGATPLAEIAGYGSTADAYRITDMHPEGALAAAAMREGGGAGGARLALRCAWRYNRGGECVVVLFPDRPWATP